MKTAILKTNIWDDDLFYELNIDTKLLYLLLLSAPERGVSDVYFVSDRILIARSGLNDQQLRVCKKQLEDKELVAFNGKYIWLKGSAYVLPKKGRFTDDALMREAEDLPEDIKQSFNSSLIVKHYYDTIHNNKDNNIDINKDVDKGYKLFNKRRQELFSSKSLTVN